MSDLNMGEKLQLIADDAVARALSAQTHIIVDLEVKKALRDAADIIVDRFTPLCVCPEHGGYDVADVVARIARMLNDEADSIGAGR